MHIYRCAYICTCMYIFMNTFICVYAYLHIHILYEYSYILMPIFHKYVHILLFLNHLKISYKHIAPLLMYMVCISYNQEHSIVIPHKIIKISTLASIVLKPNLYLFSNFVTCTNMLFSKIRN